MNFDKLTLHKENAMNAYGKYKKYTPALFFIVGFLFDLIMLDKFKAINLLQQSVFLFSVTLLIYFELLYEAQALSIHPKFKAFWRRRVSLEHFLLGSLLSAFTIFYFKSASLSTSLVFMLLLASILVLNEFPIVQSQGIVTRGILVCFCMISFMIYFVPVVLGKIGVWVFLLSLFLSFLMISLLLWAWERRLKGSTELRSLRVSTFLLHILIIVLYFSNALPPVPISLKHIGVYHALKKSNGQYTLYFDRSWWRFWESGAQTFIAQPGDRIYIFSQITSPTQFKERINIKWMLYNEKSGWTNQDNIPMTILGGRNQGFRGYVYKNQYVPGLWKVIVETSDKREIGRITFTVLTTNKNVKRDFKTLTF